ncbi:MAG TPA: GIY-YIG nuclease family protein [Pirellulales bacterium]|nr:GIY-YIG nuclease family protein [Pirellulales bacterium]
MKSSSRNGQRVVDPKLDRVSRIKPKRHSKNGFGKGALIKGMTKRLPHEILENPLFQVGLKSIMRGYAGIYALYRGKKLYYVGLTKNLLGRIRWHLKDRHAQKWDSFVIFRIKRVNYLKDVETLLTNLISTPGNRVKGKLPRDADINRMLRIILREETAEIRKIEKALR